MELPTERKQANADADLEQELEIEIDIDDDAENGENGDSSGELSTRRPEATATRCTQTDAILTVALMMDYLFKFAEYLRKMQPELEPRALIYKEKLQSSRSRAERLLRRYWVNVLLAALVALALYWPKDRLTKLLLTLLKEPEQEMWWQGFKWNAKLCDWWHKLKFWN